ncbi:helix-turn-helix domain-containing protein [Chitinophaga qingshengii]|uniref:AraC family transcriptional regulator n=1 Tax=Chitinophaga qingshengii TaxID=1569794 RepID=A0ABR7TUY4_9BACT|nr:helix-turn-helix domain-containing protein [Chitinophaga qingshengii]MBC9934297.1 AraC family transcriptional regulator [Chitinophaga qingshengii]
MQAIEFIDQQYFTGQYRYISPSPDLEPHVVFYWLLDLRRPLPDDEEFRELLLANMNSSLVLNMGAPFDICNAAGQLLHSSIQSELIGYQTTPVTYRHYANNFLAGIKFKPASLNYLFGVKGADMQRQTLSAHDVLTQLPALEAAVYDAPDMPAIKTLLEKFLRGYVGAATGNHRFDYVLQSLNSPALQQSGFRLKKLAGLLYVSPRTLERYFNDSLNISPKKCLAILRFRHAAAQYIQHGYKADWEELGYHDFSHFRKEWHKWSA